MQQLEVKGYWNSFWTNRKNFGSQNDFYFQELSSDAIIHFLKPEYTVLNVGCGDGYGFDKYSDSVSKIIGMDYSSEAIEKANKQYKSLIDDGKAKFIVGDLLEKQPDLVGMFDAVISERCLCNLDTEENQKQALAIISDYLKPNGIAIICEPSEQGYNSLDKIRSQFALPPIKRHWHNLLINEEIFKTAKNLVVKDRFTFGVYTLISRLFYPLYIYPEEPKFDSDINKISAILCKEMMSESGYENIPSQHVLYVLRRV